MYWFWNPCLKVCNKKYAKLIVSSLKDLPIKQILFVYNLSWFRFNKHLQIRSFQIFFNFPPLLVSMQRPPLWTCQPALSRAAPFTPWGTSLHFSANKQTAEWGTQQNTHTCGEKEKRKAQKREMESAKTTRDKTLHILLDEPSFLHTFVAPRCALVFVRVY